MPTNRIVRILSNLPMFAQQRIDQANNDLDWVDLNLTTHRAFNDRGLPGLANGDLIALLRMHSDAMRTLAYYGLEPKAVKAWEKPIQMREYYRDGTLGSTLEFDPNPSDDYLDQ